MSTYESSSSLLDKDVLSFSKLKALRNQRSVDLSSTTDKEIYLSKKVLYDRLIKEEKGSLLKRYQDWRSDKGLLGLPYFSSSLSKEEILLFRRYNRSLPADSQCASKACGSQPANSQCASTNTPNMRCERNYPMGSCIIGCQNPCQVGFIPCGHVCMCSRCWERASSPKACPMCRKLVERHIRLFLSCVSTTQVPRDETQHVDDDSYHAKFYQHYPTLTSSQVKQEDGTVMI